MQASPRRRGAAVVDVPAANQHGHPPTALAHQPRARRRRRPPSLHAAVRPRARVRARPGRGRRRADHVPLPLRPGRRPRRLPAPRALLPALVAPLRPLAAARAVEGSGASARAGAPRCHAADVVHVQWLAVPELDSWLLRHRAPLVLTAHDLLPRRTAAKTGLWRRAFGRFERIVVHSQRGRETLAAFGVPEEKLRVIPHPATCSAIRRARDDGRTRARTRPRTPLQAAPSTRGTPSLPASRGGAAPGCRRRRCPFLTEAEIDRALGQLTVAVFPYPPRARPERRAAPARSVPACPRWSTTSAASPSRCAPMVRGASSLRTTSRGSPPRSASSVDDETALADARAGALRGRAAS